MNRKIVIATVVVSLSCFGVIGVQALPVCEKVVKSYKQIRVRNKVSPLTAARWAAWGATHPDFKPHARPKYKLANKEIIRKVAFACAAPPTVSAEEIALLPPEPLTDILETIPTGSDVMFPGPPTINEVATNNTPALPYVPPYAAVGPTPQPAPVPEPSELLLLFTGLAGIAMLRTRRTAEQI